MAEVSKFVSCYSVRVLRSLYVIYNIFPSVDVIALYDCWWQRHFQFLFAVLNLLRVLWFNFAYFGYFGFLGLP